MAAQLFGVPHSLLHGNGQSPMSLPSLRADAVMSGSNKVHIQATVNRVGVPKSSLTTAGRSEQALPPSVPAAPEPVQDLTETNTVTAPKPVDAPAVFAESAADPDVTEEPTVVVSQALTMNLVTLTLETTSEPEAAVEELPIETDTINDPEAITTQSFQVLSLKQLRALCKHLNVPTTGNKTVLIDRATAAQLSGPLPSEFAFLSPWYTKTL